MIRLKKRKFTLFTAFSALLLLAYFIIISTSLTTNIIITTNVFKKNPNRSKCCMSTGPDFKDICGRENCTSGCSDPISFIPEFDAKGEKAFFVETLGNNKLDTRQACAVESLALLNPTLKVYVLFTGRLVNYTDDTLHALLEKYDNLNFVGVELDEYMARTPIEHWYQCTDWKKGKYHISHLSDALRFLTLAKYGEYYFDLDVIQLRPVLNYRNFTATENGKDASAGAIHASYGHPLMQMAVENFSKDYRGYSWAHNGPALLTRVLKKWCGVEKFEFINSTNCQGFQVLPKPSFYPVPYTRWREYFAENKDTSKNVTANWLTEEVIAIHVWNKMSAEEPIRKNSTQLYVRLARSYCPVTFSEAPDMF